VEIRGSEEERPGFGEGADGKEVRGCCDDEYEINYIIR
jgi:hypothetical protein